MVKPTGGIRRFRQNASLSAEGGDLVVVDPRGKQSRFALDGSPHAPARHLTLLGSPHWMIVDGHDQAVVQGTTDHWDFAEIKDLTESVGMGYHFHGEHLPAPSLRPDAVVLDEPRWARNALPAVAAASGLSLVVAYSGLVPLAAAIVFFAAVWGLFGAYWLAGGMAPQRRGKSWAERQEILARSGLDEASKWKPPVEGRLRLFLEMQCGTPLATGLALLVDGKYGPAAVMPVEMLLSFFLTHWVAFTFLGFERFSWWGLLLVSNAVAFALFLVFLFS
ncbi:MAG: hypothetical protein ACRDY7_05860 [Acidimicrobiia bacterium]